MFKRCARNISNYKKQTNYGTDRFQPACAAKPGHRTTGHHD